MPHNIIIDKPTTNPSSKSSYEYKRSLMYLITQVVVRETDKYYDDLNISKQSNKIINNYIQIRPIESDDLAKSVKNTVFLKGKAYFAHFIDKKHEKSLFFIYVLFYKFLKITIFVNFKKFYNIYFVAKILEKVEKYELFVYKN